MSDSISNQHLATSLGFALIIAAMVGVACYMAGLNDGHHDILATAAHVKAGEWVSDPVTGVQHFWWYTFNPDMKP